MTTALKKVTARCGGAPTVEAFGCTFVLAPSFSLKLDREDAMLMTAFATFPGLAVLVRSEVQPTNRSAELLYTDEALLCADALRLLREENAGGASHVSEALSMELLQRAFGARLLKTELEIIYWPANGSITDFAVELAGACVGVSVTRAMCAPGVPFGAAQAEHLLRKKLSGVVASTQTCCGLFNKQILHVWARGAAAADALDDAYARLEPALLADTVVLVTVCEGPQLSALFDEKATAAAVPRAPRAPKGAKDAEHERILRESDPCLNGLRRGGCTAATVGPSPVK